MKLKNALKRRTRGAGSGGEGGGFQHRVWQVGNPEGRRLETEIWGGVGGGASLCFALLLSLDSGQAKFLATFVAWTRASGVLGNTRNVIAKLWALQRTVRQGFLRPRWEATWGRAVDLAPRGCPRGKGWRSWPLPGGKWLTRLSWSNDVLSERGRLLRPFLSWYLAGRGAKQILLSAWSRKELMIFLNTLDLEA